MSNTAPSRADPMVVFPLSRWCPPQETSQPHPPPSSFRGVNFYWIWFLGVQYMYLGIHKKSALVQIMAGHQTGDKPLMNQWWPRFFMPCGIDGPQWVNSLASEQIWAFYCRTLKSVKNACVCDNSLSLRQNGHHFADDIFKLIFLMKIVIFWLWQYVHKGPIDNMPALVQIMAWRWTDDKPLSECLSKLSHHWFR